MSIDVLQDKIRKLKNPSAVCFDAYRELLPPAAEESADTTAGAFFTYYGSLLMGLKGVVPAVRFSFGSYALWGQEGLGVLSGLLVMAREQGFYVVLDAPQVLSPDAAANTAAMLSESEHFPCDALVISSYMGSDCIRPFLELCKKGKSVFCMVRTANKSATEVQDLLTGGRLVHTAAADVVNRHGQAVLGKCGYSQLGLLAAASAADSLRTLRGKYDRMFLLLDGYDYPNSNAKNCSYAFDRLGHGAAACAGASVVGAWKEEAGDPVELAVRAAERMKKNLGRYTTVL